MNDCIVGRFRSLYITKHFAAANIMHKHGYVEAIWNSNDSYLGCINNMPVVPRLGVGSEFSCSCICHTCRDMLRVCHVGAMIHMGHAYETYE